MTQEDKELLLKDLCARLPYGVKLQKTYDTSDPVELYLIDLNNHIIKFYKYKGEGLTMCDVGDIERFGKLRYKPYLFPFSSMTHEQRKEFITYAGYEKINKDVGCHSETHYYDMVGIETCMFPNSSGIDWLNKNHFDYRGLISKGLAIDATGLNIY